MITKFRLIFSFAILFGIFISFSKCESYKMKSTENGNFEKFFSEKLDSETFAVTIDVSHGNLDKIKKFWKNYNVSSDSRIYFGIIRESGYEISNTFINAKEMMQRIQSLQSSINTNTLRKDLFQCLQTILSVTPSNIDVLFFTGRPLVRKPSHQILFEKLNEKHIRVFVIWTGDTMQNMNTFRSITRSSNGFLQFLSTFVGDTDYDEEISNSQLNETTEIEKSMHEKDIITNHSHNFNNTNISEKRLSRMSLSAENNLGENRRQKLAKIRFPEENSLEEIPEHEMANNVQSKNSSEKQQSRANFFIPVIVEVSSTSNLECLPGSNHRIAFDVTNNLLTPMLYRFFITDIRNLKLVNIQPDKQILYPMRRITVEVTVQAFQTQTNNMEGGIAFAASTENNGRTIRRALIYITNKISTDSWEPKISYSYKGDCREHDKPDTCYTADWSVEATIQDEESGLKKILSEPYGLLYQQPFTAGTKSQVSVLYSASCCQPKVDIYAEDGKGNYIKRPLDINNQGLLMGEIAAVVVGVLLLIFIIIAIIVSIVLIRRRNQSKLIIPRYQSSSSS